MKSFKTIFFFVFFIIYIISDILAQNFLNEKIGVGINLGSNIIIPVVDKYYAINNNNPDAGYNLTIQPTAIPGFYVEFFIINPIKRKKENINLNWSYGFAYNQKNVKLQYDGEFNTESGTIQSKGIIYTKYKYLLSNIKVISNIKIDKYLLLNSISFNLNYYRPFKDRNLPIKKNEKIDFYLNYEIGIKIPIKNRYLLIPYISTRIVDFKPIFNNKKIYYDEYFAYMKEYFKEFTFGIYFIFSKPFKNIENEK
ncbi:MAG: hypothetical protein HY738_11250 [Bacteroidia bacterium]|nr:hypothetical protein [Bacteroidia bacterium]